MAIHKAGGNLESIIHSSVGGQGDDSEELDDKPNVDWITEPFTPIRSQEKDPLGPMFIQDNCYRQLPIPMETLG